jgi:hypothetical protein
LKPDIVLGFLLSRSFGGSGLMSEFWDLKSLAFRRPLAVRRTELDHSYLPRNSVVIEWAMRLGSWFSPEPKTVGLEAD